MAGKHGARISQSSFANEVTRFATGNQAALSNAGEERAGSAPPGKVASGRRVGFFPKPDVHSLSITSGNRQ